MTGPVEPGPTGARFGRNEAELAERAARVVVEIRLALLEAASAYTTMAPGEDALDATQRAAAWRWLQRVAGLRREADVLGLGALGDDFLDDVAETLLSALEDSLVLALSEDGERRSLVVAVDEVIGRALALEELGTWGG